MIFDNIQFDKKAHRYSLNGKILTPTTELTSTLEREIDWNDKAKTVGIREGIATDLILKKWDDDKNKAAEKGTQIHKYIERRLKHDTEYDTLYPEMIAFDSFWQKAKEKLTIHKIEWIIGDYDLGIGGMIDLVAFSENTKKYHIFDWKSNKKFTLDNRWQNLKSPFDDLEDCHLIKYSLQLSVYKAILQLNTELELGESYIIWLNSDYLGELYHSFKTFDFTDRVKEWVLSLC